MILRLGSSGKRGMGVREILNLNLYNNLLLERCNVKQINVKRKIED